MRGFETSVCVCVYVFPFFDPKMSCQRFSSTVIMTVEEREMHHDPFSAFTLLALDTQAEFYEPTTDPVSSTVTTQPPPAATTVARWQTCNLMQIDGLFHSWTSAIRTCDFYTSDDEFLFPANRRWCPFLRA